MNIDGNYEHLSICKVHENNIEELLSLEWLANILGSEKCRNDISEQLNIERKQLLTYFKEFTQYCKKSENCLMGYTGKLNLQDNSNLQEKSKIILKK